jgi:hypothetical protein
LIKRRFTDSTATLKPENQKLLTSREEFCFTEIHSTLNESLKRTILAQNIPSEPVHIKQRKNQRYCPITEKHLSILMIGSWGKNIQPRKKLPTVHIPAAIMIFTVRT